MSLITPKVPPIYQSSVFTFGSLAELEAYYQSPGQDGHYCYSRAENPTSDDFVKAVAKLEGAAGGVATGAGLAGLLAAVLACCQSGDHILCPEELYGGSIALLSGEMARLGLDIGYVPLADLYDLGRWLRPNTKLVLAETLSNPLLTVLDGPRLANACRAHGVRLLIDHTFASPILGRPLVDWGVDLVWHSATKYLSGHSDVTAGVVVARDEALVKRLRQVGTNLGLTLSPMEAWLASRGIKTLRLRMRQHSENALTIARFLAEHPRVAQVFYPGLPPHPGHDLAAAQLGGWFGGMMSIRLQDDTAEAADAFFQRTKLFPLAPSLAGVASSSSYPVATSHRPMPADRRAKLGITPGLIRLSIGIEEVEELLDDLRQALN